MNDHDAFERQLAETIEHGGRPSRPVDVAGIVRAAAATESAGRWSIVTRRLRDDAPSAPTGRGLSMFSALKLVAATAIVALFGGFLMSGLLTPSEGEPVPATTTDDLVAGLTTQEVESGVLRIANDGYRDLYHQGRSFAIDGGIVVGAQGAVWVYDGLGRFYRVGDEQTYELADQFLMDFEPEADRDHVESLEAGADLLNGSPDGRLWLVSGNEIFFFDPELGEWDLWNGDIRAADMAVDDTGTVWATLTDELVRFNADGAPTRYVLPDEYREIESLLVSPDGVAQVTAGPSAAGGTYSETADVLRLVDGAFIPVATLAPPPYYRMAAGPGGALWTGGGYDWESGDDFPHRDLRRLDEGGWTTFTAADGIEPWGGKPGFIPWEMTAASPDGSVWVDATKEASADNNVCDGLGRFDGASWTSYLAGHCIADIDFTTSGDAWVLAEGPYLDGNGWGVFLIHP